MALAEPKRHIFTMGEWERLVRIGFWKDGGRGELVDGEIIDTSASNDGHQSCIDRLNMLFVRQVGDRAIVRVHGAFRPPGKLSELYPDVALLRRRGDWYGQSYPSPADTYLVVEVADSSVSYDRNVKADIYAQAGVPECWVVDLSAQVVHVLRSPTADGYTAIGILRPGVTLAIQALPDIRVPVATALGLN